MYFQWHFPDPFASTESPRHGQAQRLARAQAEESRAHQRRFPLTMIQMKTNPLLTTKIGTQASAEEAQGHEWTSQDEQGLYESMKMSDISQQP
mmetsp:Transcript_2338/g.5110  ORF Transcript_2338/g.5110 Transcript_2338/m.5110 type:complete len:93 (-) Transcript_2338:142-420(-)